jgi:hypothetical protein
LFYLSTVAFHRRNNGPSAVPHLPFGTGGAAVRAACFNPGKGVIEGEANN